MKDDGEELDAETSKLFFMSAEVKPLFYGGSEALRSAIFNLIDHDKIKNHHGKVSVRFIINNDGFVESAEIVNSVDPFLNEEAIRIIKSLPRWQPGFQQGYFVRCSYIIPIGF